MAGPRHRAAGTQRDRGLACEGRSLAWRCVPLCSRCVLFCDSSIFNVPGTACASDRLPYYVELEWHRVLSVRWNLNTFSIDTSCSLALGQVISSTFWQQDSVPFHFTNMLRASFGPSASATHIADAAFATSSASASGSNTLDTLTIVLGVIDAVLTLATIVVGVIQIRVRCRHHNAERGQVEHELDEQDPKRGFAGNMMPAPPP